MKLIQCLLIAMLIFVLCTGPASGIAISATPGIISDASYFYLENDHIKVAIDKNTGFINTVENKHTGVTSKKAGSGCWPFKINLSDGTSAEISSQTPNRVSSANITSEGEDSVLLLTYNSLTTNGNTDAGVKAVVKYTLNPNDSHFKFNVRFSDNGTKSINLISLCEGGSLTSGESGARLVVPLWGEMAYWDDPLSQWGSYSVSNPYRMSYPGQGWNNLEMGFMDYSGINGGIGIAYINRQQTIMDFKLATDDGGMSFAMSLLNPKIKNMTVPIIPGESFNTDNIIVAAHTGDWHTMGDIYRTEYQKAFTVNGKADYLTWNDISPIVKQSDFGLRYFQSSFADVLDDVNTNLNALGKDADPNRLMVWYSGQNEHGYGHDTPTMLPANPGLGGTTGLIAMTDKLHKMGANIYMYEHPFAFATDSSDYPAVSSANPNQSSAAWNGANHYYLIIDDLVMNLWKNKLVPELRTTHPDGLQFDQGSLQFTVGITGTALDRLSQHNKAIAELSKYVRSSLNPGKASYLASEGFCDLTSRYMDICQSRWDKEQLPANGGDLILGGRQFVFPQYYNMNNSASRTNDGLWKNKRQYIAIIGAFCNLNEGEEYVTGSGAEYLWFKRQMREIQAPGYPFNYRDTVGTASSNSNLWVRSFVDSGRVTVTFWANGKMISDTTVTLTPSDLGLSGERQRFSVDLEKNKTGYIIYNTLTGKVEKTSLASIQPSPEQSPKTEEENVNSTQSPTSGPSNPASNQTSASTQTPDPGTKDESAQSAANTSGDQDTAKEVSLPQSSQSAISSSDQTPKKNVNIVLIVSVIAFFVLFVGFILFILVTETPKPIYKMLIKLFKRNSEVNL